MATLAEQRKAQQVIGRFDTFKRHLIDLILASEPTDTELYAKVLLLRAATDAVIAEYTRQLDFPTHFEPHSTGPAMASIVERGIKAEKRRLELLKKRKS